MTTRTLKPGSHGGIKNPFYGKQHSEESKEKMRKAKRGIYDGINNPMYGKHHSQETKIKIAKAQDYQKSPIWKGDSVGYHALHVWIKRRLEKPKVCQKCGARKPYDLVNISGTYRRDLTDFQWWCRRCHVKSDGRIKNLISYPYHKPIMR